MKSEHLNLIYGDNDPFDSYKSLVSINLGDQTHRFRLIDDGKLFIYDSLLSGYWSYSSNEPKNLHDAKQFLFNNGFYKHFQSKKIDQIHNRFSSKVIPQFRLPTALELSSLLSGSSKPLIGHINPLFTDNKPDWYWVHPHDRFYRLGHFSTECFRFLKPSTIGVCSSISRCLVRGFSPIEPS